MGEGKVLIFLGRLEEIKGVRLLIEAVRSIPDFHSGKAFLYIAGDGQERSSLEGLVSQYRLEKGVRFLGTISREDVPVLLASADIVCVPSIVQRNGVVEGMPVVVLEALAMGKVLVASRVGGIPDLIQDGVNGFLVEPGNFRDLVSKINMALGLRNEIAPVCEAARRTAEKFSLESVAQRYAEVFHSLQVTS
jgi:colanic acid/amylovoran biosynthesis glycosyltransferase